ncbi:hypothetical protein PGH42_18015 [Legionella pneumophila]|nr:hypothetical protein PGH42_18015 [Legionella pneumophila]
MSAARQINNPKMRQWRILLVYNIYRIVSIFLFLGIYYFSYINKYYPLLFLCIAFAYLVFALIFLYFWHRKILSFDKQVFLSGTIDVIAISSMLGIIGNLESGYGILLNVTIAALSILVPGRLAIYFASLASCLLLCGNVLQFFIYNQKDLSTFFIVESMGLVFLQRLSPHGIYPIGSECLRVWPDTVAMSWQECKGSMNILSNDCIQALFMLQRESEFD